MKLAADAGVPYKLTVPSPSLSASLAASRTALVGSIYPTRADLPILSRSTLRSLAPRKEEAVKEARKRIDRALSS